MTDDEAARKAKAKEIQREIEDLTPPHSTDEAADKAPREESPRDFVHRRMSELEEDKRSTQG